MPKADRSEWAQAGDKAADAATSLGEMAGHTAQAVGAAASQQADALTASAGSGIEHLGDMLSENTPHEGLAGSISQAAAHSIQRGGRYLEDAKFSGATASLTELIRQHPLAAVMAGIAAGYLAARALKD